MNDLSLLYIKRREHALLQQRQRQQMVQEQIPEIVALQKEFVFLQSQRAMAAMQKNTNDEEVFLKQIEDNQQKQADLLIQHGFDQQYLELTYECPICRDYGFVDGHECVCAEQMRFANEKQAQKEAFSNQTFASFDENIFPTENGQRDRMIQLRQIAQTYVETFPDNNRNNFLLLGGCGLGKTFLSNCMGSAIMDRGFAVKKITAGQFQRMIVDEVIGNKRLKQFHQLMQVEFLVFDDLGSEPPVNDLIAQYFYMLIEERMSRKKSWVITSNLSMENLRDRYGMRTFSRLFDKQNTHAILLNGQDLRIL